MGLALMTSALLALCGPDSGDPSDFLDSWDPAEPAAAAPMVSWAARASLILPLKDDADTDPLFGVGGKRRQSIDQKSFWQVGADIHFGGGDERVAGVKVDYDLILVSAYGAYGQYINAEAAPLGFAWYAGAGLVYETYDGDANHPSLGKVKFDDDNVALMLKGGGDYAFTENLAVNAEFLVFLGTDTIEVGLLGAFEFRF